MEPVFPRLTDSWPICASNICVGFNFATDCAYFLMSSVLLLCCVVVHLVFGFNKLRPERNYTGETAPATQLDAIGVATSGLNLDVESEVDRKAGL